MSQLVAIGLAVGFAAGFAAGNLVGPGSVVVVNPHSLRNLCVRAEANRLHTTVLSVSN